MEYGKIYIEYRTSFILIKNKISMLLDYVVSNERHS